MLSSIGDKFENLCFVVRDYGFFLTTRERAEHINAPTIPEDIPLYLPEGVPE